MTYDKVGRITRLTNNTAGAVTDYIYDAPGDLTSTITKVGGQQVNKTTNAYNADGTRLIRREVTTTGTTTSTATTLYRSDGTELTCLNTCSATNNADLARGTRPIVATDRGVPVAVRNSTGWTWLLADNQHTIRVARDPDGTIRRTFYGPYGDTPSVSNNQTAPNTPNKRGYLNQPHDANGDIRLGIRNYTPMLGVLATPDPLLNQEDPQTLNPYSYARNNPIAAADPSGAGPCSNTDLEVSCAATDPSGAPPDDLDTTSVPEDSSPDAFPVNEYLAQYLSGAAAPDTVLAAEGAVLKAMADLNVLSLNSLNDPPKHIDLPKRTLERRVANTSKVGSALKVTSRAAGLLGAALTFKQQNEVPGVNEGTALINTTAIVATGSAVTAGLFVSCPVTLGAGCIAGGVVGGAIASVAVATYLSNNPDSITESFLKFSPAVGLFNKVVN